MLTDREDRIVTLIDGAITAQVEAYPDNPKEYKPKRDKVVLVSYEGKQNQSNMNGRGTRTLERTLWRVTYMYRNRRTHQGVYDDMETVRAALVGERFTEDSNVNFPTLQSEVFVRYDPERGRWIYRQVYSIPYYYTD